MEKVKVLELNNFDLLGSRFNGYDLISNCPKVDINMLVNYCNDAESLAQTFLRPNRYVKYDHIINLAEKNILGAKNQTSINEFLLTKNRQYKTADILHFHMYHNMNLPIEFLLRIPKSKKIIIDIHDTYWLTSDTITMLEVFNFTNTNQAAFNAQRQRVLSSIDAEFVVHSPYILKLFQSSPITKNLKKPHLINFGIDTNFFKPLKNQAEIRQKLKIPQDNLVLFCRSQKEFKGIDYIIGALKEIKKPKITIVTVGKPHLLDALKKQHQVIDAKLIDDDSKILELYNVCDIFLSPSTEESFGFMPAEAMACEKPVIIFGGTALPYTTNAPKIGFLAPKTTEGFKDAILYLANNQAERLRRGKQGRVYVQRKYSLSKYYRDYENLFVKLGQSGSKRNVVHLQGSNCPTGINELNERLKIIGKAAKDDRVIKKKTAKYPIINYNDIKVQKEIFKFNKSLYRSLMIIENKKRVINAIKNLLNI